ncbi:MAG TPA: choice-of-anchor B family protein [Bacteroidia bacterium]|nr:choice-of-anchor B family protein [Bacteroidia bacterium]
MKFKTLSVCLLLANLVTAQNVNVKLRSQLKYSGQELANICGYTDPETGKEYALVGTSKGASIVDISNPDSPKEVKFITGPTSEWREIKVKGDYAYVTTEGGGGLQIINMKSLPDASGIVYKSWTGGSAGSLTSIHALHIDGNFVYLYGSKLFNGGALVADISDPYNPVYVGNYQATGGGKRPYVHDGFVKNDTLYACHIYEGFTDIVDFRDKKNPKVLGSIETPGKFSHNSWLNENSKVMFTTDEVSNSFLTAYDISDPANITEIDRIQSNPGSKSIVHNTHIIKIGDGQFAVTSWYRDGFTIVDVTRPNNMVQVGNYDTYAGSGSGFNGDWGVFPFFPSKTIVVSNIEDGLFVFTPTYVRACYLEGTVTDSITNLPIQGATVQVTIANLTETTNITGNYATGMPAPGGTYTVTYSATGYIPKTLNNVVLSSGNLTVKNVKLLSKSFNGIDENELERVKVNAYPNPFTNELTISYDLQNKLLAGSSIVISDVLGRKMDEIKIDQAKGTIALKPDIHAGIYFIRIVNGAESSQPVKIMKQENN